MKPLAVVVGAVCAAVALVCLSGFAFLTGGAASACTAPPGSLASLDPSRTDVPAVRTTNGNWDSDQAHNAATIMGVGASLGVPTRGWIIAVATAMQESRLRNLGHLGDANDHDSLGLFQQRPSQGWGTPAQLMDPLYAARKFYDKLLTVPGWQTMPVTQAAQAVQGSALPGAYAKWEIDAGQMFTALTGNGNPSAPPLDGCIGDGPDVVTLPPGFSLPPGTPPAAATAVMWALAQLGTPYSFGGDCTAAHSGNPARQCDCSSALILSQLSWSGLWPGTLRDGQCCERSREGAQPGGIGGDDRHQGVMFPPADSLRRDAPALLLAASRVASTAAVGATEVTQ